MNLIYFHILIYMSIIIIIIIFTGMLAWMLSRICRVRLAMICKQLINKSDSSILKLLLKSFIKFFECDIIFVSGSLGFAFINIGVWIDIRFVNGCSILFVHKERKGTIILIILKIIKRYLYIYKTEVIISYLLFCICCRTQNAAKRQSAYIGFLR